MKKMRKCLRMLATNKAVEEIFIQLQDQIIKDNLLYNCPSTFAALLNWDIRRLAFLVDWFFKPLVLHKITSQSIQRVFFMLKNKAYFESLHAANNNKVTGPQDWEPIQKVVGK